MRYPSAATADFADVSGSLASPRVALSFARSFLFTLTTTVYGYRRKLEIEESQMTEKPSCNPLEDRIRMLESQLQRLEEDHQKEKWMQQDFKRLAERSKDGIYQFDLAARRYSFGNRAMIEIFESPGATLEDITSKRMRLRIHPEDLEMVRMAARESLQPGRSGGEVEYRYASPDGSYRWNHDRWIVIRDDAGTPKYLEGIVTDNTKRKMAEEALKESRKQLRLLSSHLLKAQEAERSRISMELHDELGQALMALKLKIGSLKKKIQSDRADMKEDFENTQTYIDQIIENVRRLSHDLSPTILEDLGLDAALRLLLKEFANHSGISVKMDDSIIDQHFSPESQVMIYRIFQEALTNIEKHAEASRLFISIKEKSGRVEFRIEDNGKGFNVQQPRSKSNPERALGLTAMDERTRMLGGKLTIISQVGGGTQIRIEIPNDMQRDP
jgi:PAS domain S-box-containing protein